MQMQRDSNGNQFWPTRVFTDGVAGRLVPAYIGSGRKPHVVQELSRTDGYDTAMCGRTG